MSAGRAGCSYSRNAVFLVPTQSASCSLASFERLELLYSYLGRPKPHFGFKTELFAPNSCAPVHHRAPLPVPAPILFWCRRPEPARLRLTKVFTLDIYKYEQRTRRRCTGKYMRVAHPGPFSNVHEPPTIQIVHFL
jgi:hypothetical protein